KPVAITEFGCTTFRGASDKSGSGGMIVEYENNRPVRLNGDYIRDEAEQATHLRELLDIFTAEGVDTAFVCTLASYFLPHPRDSRRGAAVRPHDQVLHLPLNETHGTAFLRSCAPPSQARKLVLTNLKTHLIIRIPNG